MRYNEREVERKGEKGRERERKGEKGRERETKKEGLDEDGRERE